MNKTFPVRFTVEQLELIDNCLWQTSESIELGISACDSNSEIARTGRQDVSNIKKLSSKICKRLAEIKARQ